MIPFYKKLITIQQKNNSLLCVGLDSKFDKLPEKFQKEEYPQFAFNKYIIEQTHDLVSAYKPNSAFYEAQGLDGVQQVKMTMEYLQKYYPDIVTIDDAKRADIGSTNDGYVQAIFDWYTFDAVTLHPYLGKEALQPFLDRDDKGCIMLCRTSNPGAGEFQDVKVSNPLAGSSVKNTAFSLEHKGDNFLPLYQYIALQVKHHWNDNNNCLLVVGATYPEELAQIRTLCPDMTFLVPGIGAQGGDVEKTVRAGLDANNAGMIINSSRGIIFADDPRKAAQKLRDKINRYRNV